MGRRGVSWGREAPPWDRGGYYAAVAEPRPRRLRAALLLVVAFIATVTGVIAGVRLLAANNTGPSGDLGLGIPCPPEARCEEIFPSQVRPSPVESGDPGGVGAGQTDAGQATGLPDPGGSGRDDPGGRGNPAATPPAGDPPTVVPSPTDAGRTPSRTPKPSPTVTAKGAGGQERAPAGTPPATTRPPAKPPAKAPDPAPTRTEARRPAPKKAVVKFTVLRRVNGQYAAEVAVGNEGGGDLNGWEITIPIGGRAFAVDGARARQVGDTLVLSSAELLPPGGAFAVTIAARGDPFAPDFCRLRGGSCRVL